MSIGTVSHQSGAVFGKFDPTRANYVCGHCRYYVQTEKVADEFLANLLSDRNLA